MKSRVERHIIKPINKHYQMLDEFCFKSKNLYNFANYHVRKRFIESNEWLRYGEMDKLFKQEGMDFDYREMPSACSQQCLKLLEKNWKSFFESIKDWSKNKDKYTGRPKLPKYLKKNGRNILVLTNQQCKIKEGKVLFPKVFQGFNLNTKVENNLQQVRMLPRNKHMIIEIVYNVEVAEQLEDNGKYIGIDIGIDNFATIGNNIGSQPIIINGKGLKSMNQYYNKKKSRYQEIAKRMNKLDYTNRLNRLTIKRNNKVTDFIHKASKYVVDYALDLGANTIIIGNNKDWKRDSKMSKKVNQSFVGIPHQEFINKVIYKAENVGIKVVLTEESYTSGTSFLDNELPLKKNYNRNRRVYRGLFKSNDGILINADLNGALQIIKKVAPNAFANGVEGVGLHPVKVDI